MANPFIEKQKRKNQARATMTGHVIALENLLKRIDQEKEEELYKRISLRLEEARSVAR